MKIEVKKGGIVKRVRADSTEETTDRCPVCGTELDFIRDAGEDEDLEKLAEKYHSMEANHMRCPKCGREFLETEVGDYDWMVLREVLSFPESWIVKEGKKK